MNQDPASQGLAGWIIAAIAIVGLLWAVVAKIFSFVTRAELARRFDAQDKKFLEALETQLADRRRITEEQRIENDRRHGENRGNFDKIADRLSQVEIGQARLEGSFSRSFKSSDTSKG
jgi:hypothetical protein